MFSELLKDIGVSLSETQVKSLEKYIKAFKNYNSHTNLISKNDVNILFEKHIFDSLAFNLFITKYGCPKTVMDIGTGGGFPSVPLAMLFNYIEITAVDSTAKKVNFIKEIKTEFKLGNIFPVISRIEELPQTYKSGFDAVTTRALGSLPLILEYAIPYIKTGGYFVAYKSVDSQNELKQAQNALNVLHTEHIDTIEYNLPLKENFNRKLLIFKKKAETSDFYPRKYSLIKNNPL